MLNGDQLLIQSLCGSCEELLCLLPPEPCLSITIQRSLYLVPFSEPHSVYQQSYFFFKLEQSKVYFLTLNYLESY